MATERAPREVVYRIDCAEGVYIGVTTNPEQRLKSHWSHRLRPANGLHRVMAKPGAKREHFTFTVIACPSCSCVAYDLEAELTYQEMAKGAVVLNSNVRVTWWGYCSGRDGICWSSLEWDREIPEKTAGYRAGLGI